MTSLEFAELARRLTSVLRAAGLDVPGFRSPPRSPRLSRSLSRRPDGSCTVAVRLRARSSLAVTADMIDGALAANRLTGPAAGRVRDELWAAAEAALLESSPRRDSRLVAVPDAA